MFDYIEEKKLRLLKYFSLGRGKAWAWEHIKEKQDPSKEAEVLD